MKQGDEINRLWEEFRNYVTLDRFSPVEKGFYLLTSAIFLAVIGAVMTLILRSK
jgi:hypothetical protein